MRALQALRSYALILSVLVLSLSCGTTVEGIAIVVNVKGVPDGAKNIYALFEQDGLTPLSGMPFIVQQDLSRFAVVLTDARANQLEINLQVRGEDGCIIGSGATTVTLTAGVTKFEVSIDIVADSGCPLDVYVDGPGSVTTPSGTCSTDCEPGTACGNFCSSKVPRGQSVLLTSSVEAQALSGDWSQACTGTVSTPCMVTVNGPVAVGASFVARNCSADHVCAYPMPVGKQVRTVLALPDRVGAGSKVAAGTEIFINSPAPNFGAAPSNLGTGGMSTMPVIRLASAIVGTNPNQRIAALFADGTVSIMPPGNDYSSFASAATPALTGTIQDISRDGFIVMTDAGKIGRFAGNLATFSVDNTGSNTAPLYGVSFVPNLTSWAVGAGVILRLMGTGSTWTAVSCPTTKTLRAVHGDVAVGEGGIILEYAMNAWTIVNPGDGRTLHDVWSPGGIAFAVGDGGTVKFRGGSGGAWRDLALPPGAGTPQLTRVSGNEDDQSVFFTGTGDTVYGIANYGSLSF